MSEMWEQYGMFEFLYKKSVMVPFHKKNCLAPLSNGLVLGRSVVEEEEDEDL